MFEVSVSGWFAASHQLDLPEIGQEPLHGHNWQVRATLRGPRLDAHGLLADFVQLRRQLDAILAELHDRHLNDSPAFAERNPSAENVAVHVAEQLARDMPDGVVVARVEVEEAPGCVACYCPDAAG